MLLRDIFNVRKGIVVGCIVGVLCAVGFLALCAWFGNMDAPTDTSLTWTFRPWWRHWGAAIGIFLFFGFCAGLIAAARPEFRKRPGKRN